MSRVKLKTLLDRSIKNMGDVQQGVKDKILLLIRKAYEEDINVQISSGYRSDAEQQKLYNQGRNSPGNIVTRAKPGQSVHNYGLAVDYFLTTWDGAKATWTVNNDWRRVAEIGKSLGFSWGGDWTGFTDYPHLELTNGLSWRDLNRGRRPSNEFLNKGVTRKGHSGYKTYLLQQKLKSLGYKLKVDGFFGSGTDKVVRQFQRVHALEVDGFYGPSTQAKLEHELEGVAVAENEKEEENKMEENKDQPSKWAKEDWEEAKENGYFDGSRPQDTITREEAAVVVNRLRHNFREIIKRNEGTIENLTKAIQKLNL
ncbi:peptidoglycan-binding protein [Halobacillus salinus]|uniref:peptidoglycan-binding protein n=1 Tax=Halobacillus salinus TaxID=192814 RepID=UPI0009A58DF7|nr:peptidoglycan-binding protein [Halobacillus salinus]